MALKPAIYALLSHTLQNQEQLLRTGGEDFCQRDQGNFAAIDSVPAHESEFVRILHVKHFIFCANILARSSRCCAAKNIGEFYTSVVHPPNAATGSNVGTKPARTTIRCEWAQRKVTHEKVSNCTWTEFIARNCGHGLYRANRRECAARNIRGM